MERRAWPLPQPQDDLFSRISFARPTLVYTRLEFIPTALDPYLAGTAEIRFLHERAFDSRFRWSRFEIEILDERHLIALFAVHEFIHESLGQQNAEATRTHSIRLTIFDVA